MVGNVAVGTGHGRGSLLGAGTYSSSFLDFSHKAFPYSMDDTDPHKFFMSGENKWVMTTGTGDPRRFDSASLPHISPQASRAMCPGPASCLAPASLCSPTRRCWNLGRCVHRAGCRRIPNLFPHFPGFTFRTWGFYPTMEAMCPVRRVCERLWEL